MTDDDRADIFAGRKTASEAGATLLVAGGLIAAFGAASCCALPLPLGSLGFGSLWLGSLALLVGPHRPVLLAAAVICLLSGGGVLLWRGRSAASACAFGASGERSAPTAWVAGALSLGAVLTVLGFVFA